jgi:hypothetical protein
MHDKSTATAIYEERMKLKEEMKISVENVPHARGLQCHSVTSLMAREIHISEIYKPDWLNRFVKTHNCTPIPCIYYTAVSFNCQIPGFMSTFISLLGQSPCFYKTLF